MFAIRHSCDVVRFGDAGRFFACCGELEGVRRQQCARSEMCECGIEVKGKYD